MNSADRVPNRSRDALPAETGLEGRVEFTSSGAINDIFVFSDNEGKKVLRLRTREEIFGYEKHFFKEPIISSLLASARPFDAAHNESVLELALQRVLGNRVGGESQAAPLPKILSYDHGRASLPVLWMVQEYIPGPVLVEVADEHYWYRLGTLIGKLHTIRLERSGPFDNRTQTAEERIQSIVEGIKRSSPVPITRTFNSKALAQGAMALCHGDVHGCNVIAGEELTLLDWDNSVIDFPELDLVKPLHWNVFDSEGFFTQHEAHYGAYLKGHQDAYGAAPNSERMKLYELSWLIRVYCFEKLREASGRIPAPPAPVSERYLPRIRELANGD